MARELVGVARPDRRGVPDRRLRGPPRMARRAVPAAVPVRRHARGTRRSAFSSPISSGSRASPRARRRAEVAAVLDSYWGTAAPLITRQFGGEVEKFIGDGIVAMFNSRGDQPDHAVCAPHGRSRAAAQAVRGRGPASRLATHARRGQQRRRGRPGDRRRRPCCVSIGRRHGQHGRTSGDAAPAGGVLIGADTYRATAGRGSRRGAVRLARSRGRTTRSTRTSCLPFPSQLAPGGGKRAFGAK